MSEEKVRRKEGEVTRRVEERGEWLGDQKVALTAQQASDIMTKKVLANRLPLSQPPL